MPVTYPLVSDYKNAIIDSESFATLNTLEPCYVGKDVYFATGGPAVVFKMYDSQRKKHIAIKCFIKELTTRQNSFQCISRHLSSLRENPYFVSYQYYDKEIWVNNDEYPVLFMPWIEGKTLGVRIAELCAANDTENIRQLAYTFDKMALWLLNQELAHGDLKPDNIIVTPNNELILVDYDGMFVPSLSGSKSPELGTAEYRHPKRTGADFNHHLDDFPILVLSLSLHALAIKPSLYSKGQGGDALLFKQEDYKNLLKYQHIAFFQDNTDNDILHSRFSMLMYSVTQPIIALMGLKELLKITASLVQQQDNHSKIPESLMKQWTEYEQWCNNIEFKDEQIVDEITLILDTTKERQIKFVRQDEGGNWYDEQGIQYNAEKNTLLSVPLDITEVIIPKGIKAIGKWAFSNCASITTLTEPGSSKPVYENAFFEHSAITNISIPNSVTTISNRAFESCDSLTSITIPNSVTTIGESAFKSCNSLKSIKISNFITTISKNAFSGCYSLISITIPNSVTEISDRAFSDCESLTSIVIPDSVTKIGKHAFVRCSSLTTITIPESITKIGDGAFFKCSSLPKELQQEIIKRFGTKVFQNPLDAIVNNAIQALINK